MSHFRRATAALRPGWRRGILIRRALAAALAVAALVLAVLPQASSERPVLVTTADVPAGGVLEGSALAVREWPADLVPSGSLTEVEAAAGRVLLGAARAGEPITDRRLAGASATGPGEAAVAVRPADAGLATVLVPGSRVDVVTAGVERGEPVVLAADALVLAVDAKGGVVTVTMPRNVAARVAAAGLTEQVAVTLR